MKTMLKVTAQWDDDAKVWVAESEDVPGLITESDTMSNLIAKLKVMVPEMLHENGNIQSSSSEIPFELFTSRTVIAHSTAH
jgi:predicted RNase H-like HicB family nuclease